MKWIVKDVFSYVAIPSRGGCWRGAWAFDICGVAGGGSESTRKPRRALAEQRGLRRWQWSSRLPTARHESSRVNRSCGFPEAA